MSLWRHCLSTLMNDIPEAEARELLQRLTFCELDGEWSPEKTQPGTFAISAGMTDEEGISTMMQVKLCFRRSLKTGIVRYVFSVFKRTPYSLERVYQLDVRQCKKKIKNLHDRSHEQSISGISNCKGRMIGRNGNSKMYWRIFVAPLI